MEAAAISSSPLLAFRTSSKKTCLCEKRCMMIKEHPSPTANLHLGRRCSKTSTQRVAATNIDVAAGSAEELQVQAGVTWQIVVGAIAGVTPFVVAGIEFSKRIIAQKRCEVCGGSGLVLRDKDYFRCPGCGGFLPWQSWRRFFTG